MFFFLLFRSLSDVLLSRGETTLTAKSLNKTKTLIHISALKVFLIFSIFCPDLIQFWFSPTCKVTKFPIWFIKRWFDARRDWEKTFDDRVAENEAPSIVLNPSSEYSYTGDFFLIYFFVLKLTIKCFCRVGWRCRYLFCCQENHTRWV